MLAFALLATFAGRAGAQTLAYSDFTSTSGLTLRSVTTSGGTITLADNTNDRGSVFTHSQYSIAGFSAVFEFRISNPNGAFDSTNQQGGDGLAFVIQRSAGNSLGSSGEGLGYQGINNSVTVEFDTWLNSTRSDPDSNHYGLNLNGGSISAVTAAEATRFDNGLKWTVWVDYNGSTLEVRANQTGVRADANVVLSYGSTANPFNIASTISGTNAYIGFTAATGSAYGKHELLNFAFSDSYVSGGLSVVPEPSTYALFALGLAGLGVQQWRRRRGR